MSDSGWITPRTIRFPEGYPGVARDVISAAHPDVAGAAAYTLAYEGTPMTDVALRLGEGEYVRNPQRLALEEIANAKGFVRVARGHVQDMRDTLATLGLTKMPASIADVNQLAASTGNMGLIDALIGAKRAILPTWHWDDPGNAKNDVARYVVGADGSVEMFAEDAAKAANPRVTLTMHARAIDGPLAAAVKDVEEAATGIVVEDGVQLASTTKWFHEDGSMLMHLDNVVARMPVEVTEPIPNFQEIIDIRGKLLAEYADAVTYGKSSTVPDLGRAESMLDRIDQMLTNVLSGPTGMTLDEAARSRDIVEGAERALISSGKRASIPIVAGAAVAGIAIGGLISLVAMGADNASASGATSAGSVPKGATIASKSGLKVDEHRRVRGSLSMFGLGMAVGGGAALLAGSLHVPSHAFLASMRWFRPIAIATAAGGALLAAATLIGLRPGSKGYAKVIDGSQSDAAHAAAGLRGDVGVVALDEAGRTWGLLALTDTDVDGNGAGSVNVSNPPIKFASIVSAQGDEWQLRDTDFINLGSPDALNSTKLDVNDVGQLRGVRIGSNGSGSYVTTGEPLLAGKVFPSSGAALLSLYEAGEDDAVVIDIVGGSVAFSLSGKPEPEQFRARGTGVSPVTAVQVVMAGDSYRASAPGAAFDRAGGQRDIHDVREMGTSQAAELRGRRIAGFGSDIKRLGEPLATYRSGDTARAAAAELASRTLVVAMSDGSATFALTGGATDPLTTAVGPSTRLEVVSGKKQYAVAADGEVSYAGRSIAFDTSEPLGAKFDIAGASGTATRLIGSYPTRSAARAAIAGDLSTSARFVVVEAANRSGVFHAYELAGTSGTAWDQELGAATLGAWRSGDVREVRDEIERHASTWGDDIHHFRLETSRDVRYLSDEGKQTQIASSEPQTISRKLSNIDRAFNPNEAEGAHIQMGGFSGRIDRYLGSATSMAGARAKASGDASDPKSFVILQRPNNAGTYHAYLASDGGAGRSWDADRAEVALATWTDDRTSHDVETQTKSGTYGPDTYYYDVTYAWTERLESTGGSSRTIDSTRRVERSRVETSVHRTPKPADPIPESDSRSPSPIRENDGGYRDYEPEPSPPSDWNDPDSIDGDY